MKETIRLIQKSIYSPEFYKDLINKPFSYSLKYFFILILFISVAITILFSVRIVPGTSEFLKTLGPEMLSGVTDELVVSINKGIVSTNVSEPYNIKFSETILKSIEGADVVDNIENVVVIDTRTDFRLAAFDEYKTAVLITEDSIIAGTGSELRISKLPENLDLIVTKEIVKSWFDKLDSVFFIVILVIIFGTFMFVMFALLLSLLYLLFGAILILIIAKFKKLKIGYKKAYHIGIHAFTIGIFVNAIYIAYPVSKIPFFATALMIVVAWINLPIISSKKNEI